ncbi:GntR family transcriptional regulator [Paracoccus laeviglucosivorans]|uniref:DNA-binding transcriptional regulator, GntR family n=1 Tax=Paracoccus laeviglucosivorans TaxID=1197861 RepID=A0A521DJ59_9RHOB|nr:GntR family transcriptional regulator [Paracoccus laeviglucosivorans]SMO71622.1 DNA-binding transcriptional regulator, GntR family [Paracoccus laeviglucosivorans]
MNDTTPESGTERQQTTAGEPPAAAQMHAFLRKRIVSGDLVPGMRLSEQDIADQYDLSRQPVREAFIRLAGEGLLEVRPQRGTFVTRINMDWVLDTRFIRESVEADIVRLAARNVAPHQIALLHELLDRQSQLINGEVAPLVALDEEFHSALAAIAGKPLVWGHLQGLKVHLDRARHLISAVTPHDVMLDQHRAIVEAITAQDLDQAEAALRMHLRRVFQDLSAVVRVSPDYFDRPETCISRMHYDLTINV